VVLVGAFALGGTACSDDDPEDPADQTEQELEDQADQLEEELRESVP
jgi:hypothetical protein